MRDAIVAGVGSSASTITSAALIMVGVFAAFATSRLAEMQQMGAGLAFAILLDATIVRGLLLPATLGVLGERTWYRPGWMRTGPRRVPEAEARLAPAAR
jgi:RND superfamily putative drug exporter